MRALLMLLFLPLMVTGCRTEDKVVQADTGAIADLDVDGDGVPASEDCDDRDPTINSGALEICDGLDNDCDGEVDEGVTTVFYRDADGDSYGDAGAVDEACSQPPGTVASAGDCDDGDPRIFPGANELCNGLDDNCDGDIDEGLLEPWYLDSDGDGFGDPEQEDLTCSPASGWVQDSTDCDDSTAAANPDATEFCDEIDNDCDGDTDEGVTTTYWADSDADGFGDPARFTEACSVPVGYADVAQDCDDGVAAVNPDATEVCNSVDDDCDGTTDEDDAADALSWWRDADGDGSGVSSTPTQACNQPSGYVAAGGGEDCDDANATTYPGALEYCDGEDDDCDGTIDEDDAVDAQTWWLDADSDGFGGSRLSVSQCAAPAGYVGNTTDCNDLDGAVFPGATEVCNDTDDDCDGSSDEGLTTYTWYADSDSDGFGDAGDSETDCAQPAGYVSSSSDCDDTNGSVNPAASELCDSIDNDCDGTVDENSAIDASTWWRDVDSDGYGGSSTSLTQCNQPAGYVSSSTDCNDANGSINPGASEVCNGTDDDCDSSVDEGLTTYSWYSDSDGDGYGNASSVQRSCRQPSGTVTNSSDCNDSNSSVNPAATEVCDSVDNDCDGSTDPDFVSTGFSSSSGWRINGNAARNSGGFLRLTTANQNQAGSAFYTTDIPGDRFYASFDFRMSGGTSDGADGIVFAMRPPSAATTGVGGRGGGMGWAGLSGYGVELDTYYNSGYDPNGNHVGIVNRGGTALQTNTSVPTLEDGSWHLAEVYFDGGDIQVYIDGTQYLNYTVSWSHSSVLLGFTSATGSLTDNQDVDNVTFGCY